MDYQGTDIQQLETGANAPFGLTLAIYAQLTQQLFPDAAVNVKVIESYLAEHGVEISRRRLYELNQFRSCVTEPWFRPELRREEIRTLRNASKEQDKDPSFPHANPATPFEFATNIASSVGLRILSGKHAPYVVDSSSIKREDPRSATVGFALLLAVPIHISCDRDERLPILECSATWPEPILTDSLMHFVVELAKQLQYSPAWALTSGSRILHEPYIDARLRREYLKLVGAMYRDNNQ